MEEPISRHVKVGVKPVFVRLVHSAAYEGPCRVGSPEDLDPEREKEKAKKAFERFVQDLRSNVGEDALLLDPVLLTWTDRWQIPERELEKLDQDLSDTDLFLVSGGLAQYPAIAIAKRYGKPVAMVGSVVTVDVAAHLRARGMEGYAPMNFDELSRLTRLMMVRKAISKMRILVVLEGDLIPVGVASTIWDLQDLEDRFGVGHVTVPSSLLFDVMEDLSEEESRRAERMADALMEGAEEVHMERSNILPSVRFYLATRKVMKSYGCNALSIPCFEVCAKQIAQKSRVTFCLTHSLLKDEGIPSACEGDINVLMAMALLMYLSGKSAYMGNSYPVDEEHNILAVHHDVPGLRMKGLDGPILPYEVRNFTHAGWGATIRYDFSRDVGQPVTLARFDPRATRLLVAEGRIAGGGGLDEIGCSLRAHVQVRDLVELFRAEADFGHHLAMVYGRYASEVKELGRMMGFDVVQV